MKDRKDKRKDPGRELIFIRHFSAAPLVVFRAWTDEQQLAQWWGPDGFSNRRCRVEPEPGGEIYMDMVAPDGTIFPMHGNIQQIDEPEQLVLTTTAFHDTDDNPRLKVLTTMVLTPENYGTKLTLQAVVMISTPETEYAVESMERAWSESLDKLER